MLDNILEFGFDLLIDFLPTTVWKVLVLLIGTAMTAVGAKLLDESRLVGGALTVVGVLLLVGSAVSLYRQ